MKGREAPPNADAAAYEHAIAARFVGSASELLGRLEAEPAVSGVTFASSFPGSEGHGRIEVERTGTRSWVWLNRVDIDLFTAFDVPILAGRGFVESDAARGSNAVIIDRAFAEHVLGGGDVLGRRVRHPTTRNDGESGQVDVGRNAKFTGNRWDPTEPEHPGARARSDAPLFQIPLDMGRYY